MKLGNKDIRERFTIPSGIITTQVSVLERIANEIPEISILTTKSISLKPKEGNREPIFAKYYISCFTNAVGLANPGAEEFAKQLSQIQIPENKFLLTSIFGSNLEEFVQTAEILSPYSDGLELNLSCPHAEGYGQVIGQDPDLVSEIIKSISKKVDIPIFAKLSPNIPNIGESARLCVDSGAYGITAINTAGPGYHMVDGHPVLTNKIGGLSGKAILPLGLKCIREISEKVPPETRIIACGGISSAQDIRNYEAAGANYFGIGSMLLGLDTEELIVYFSNLVEDLEEGSDFATLDLVKQQSMDYVKEKIKKKLYLASDLSLIEFYNQSGTYACPGQFIFLWIPEVGEKPFSVLNNDPLSVLIQEIGPFTRRMLQTKEDDVVYIRGPYGKEVKPNKTYLNKSNIVLVGGGTGIAALYLIAEETQQERLSTFLGAKDKNHLAYVKEFSKLGKINVATDDGSEGFKGTVVELLEQQLKTNKIKTPTFYNCGPRKMVEVAIETEKKYNPESRIFYSYDHITRCGVGICGNCATKDGLRSCVDGPFLKVNP